MTRRRVTLVVGMYSYLSSAGFAIINLLPHGLRIMLLGMLLGHLGKAPWIDRKTYFRYPWKITIGDNVGINRGCEFYPAFRTQGGTITIGDNVVLSPNVKIFTAGYDYATLDLAHSARPVVIEDHVWIGANAIILSGVTIGKGAVIGAGSIVTRDIPSFTVAVGNPARPINSRAIVG